MATYNPNTDSKGQSVISEYKQTLILRILCLITLAPLGVIFIFITLVDSGSFMWLLIGSIFLTVTILVWFNGLKFRLHLYPRGIARRNLFGERFVCINEKTKFFHRNVQEFVNGVSAGSHVFITIKDGKNSIRVNSNVKNITQLQQELRDLELKHIFPHYTSMYKNGALVTFGPFELQGSHLRYKNKSASLREIESLLLNNGKLKITLPNKMLPFCHVPVSKIPNMTTFFKLLESEAVDHPVSARQK